MSKSPASFNSSDISATLDQEVYFLESTSTLESQLLEGNYLGILESSLAKILLGQEKHAKLPPLSLKKPESEWIDFFSCLLGPGTRLGNIEAVRRDLITIGVAALNAFLQSNVTGPPLHWAVAATLFPPDIFDEPERLET